LILKSLRYRPTAENVKHTPIKSTFDLWTSSFADPRDSDTMTKCLDKLDQMQQKGGPGGI